ncbi:hypothetical protein [Haloferax larsenii]|uniref:Uncharacterized protein n=1 Tax=Haloferax larsenii TaxID=302484 RepID=A0A1H7J5C7_HALLR|nr:hypothetical protein [Haloferax larsenii]SEK69180.1 hypothetical protein SAMN04488691_1011093 [Haloferax larsenii]
MSDVSLSNVLSFLDVDDLATVVERVRARRGERTKRVHRDDRTFLFVAPEGEKQPTEVVWVDIAAEFDTKTVEVFAERCDSRGVSGTLLTTGDGDEAQETLARAFATEEQFEEPEDEETEPELAVDPEDVETPITLETLDDLVEALEEHELDEDVIDEYHEPHEPEFEEVLNEIDAEEEAAAATADTSDSGLGLTTLLLVAVVLVILVGGALVVLGVL